MEMLLDNLGKDVRETLHRMLGAIESMAEGPLSDGHRFHLATCREGVDQLFRQTNDLIGLAHPELSAPAIGPFAVREMVGEVAQLMRVLSSGKGVDLKWTIDARAPSMVKGDRAALQDLLRKLLDDSIQRVKTGDVQMAVTSVGAGPNAALVFEISDTSPGGPEDINTGETLGPGLQLARKQIEQLGGDLRVVSNPACGLTVRLTAPVLEMEDQEPFAEPWDHRDSLPRDGAPAYLNLLIAEDSDDAFDVIEAYLKHTGHRISRARHGAKAVEMTKSIQYDFILMDVNMPVMDGYTATRLIREWETATTRARTPILLLSADDPRKQLRIGAAVGCSGYLPKPATRAQLLAALAFYSRPASHPEQFVL